MSDCDNKLYLSIKNLNIKFRCEANSRIVKLTNGKITLLQSAILKFVYESIEQGKSIIQKDIENYFCLNKSTISEILKNLEENNYIKRTQVKEDGRIKEISITEEGISLHKIVGKEIDAFEESKRKKLTKEELDTFFRLIEKLEK